MPLVLADRVQETTTSTGTGTITLAGASVGFNTFSVIGDGNTTYYTIAGGSQWEVGLGTYTSSGTTLSRDVVLSSSNSNALVDFSAGVKNAFVTYPSGKAVYYDASGNTTLGGNLTALGNLGIGTSSPNYNMTVNGGSGATTIQLVNTASGTTAGDGLLIYQDGVNSRVQNTEVGNLTLWTGNNQRVTIDSSGMVLPAANNTYDLGSTSFRWRNIYTNDLHLSNGIGDYTVVEGEDELFLYNNKKGKVFKFALIEVDPSEAPPKAKAD